MTTPEIIQSVSGLLHIYEFVRTKPRAAMNLLIIGSCLWVVVFDFPWAEHPSQLRVKCADGKVNVWWSDNSPAPPTPTAQADAGIWTGSTSFGWDKRGSATGRI